jgi:NADPH:quinone reductase-like Zn-dependent oxidoreductase
MASTRRHSGIPDFPVPRDHGSFVVRPDRGELADLARLVDDGRLQPVVSQTSPLAEGRRAYESGRQTRRPGKTVLVVADAFGHGRWTS